MANEIPIGGLQLNFTDNGREGVVEDIKKLAEALVSVRDAMKGGSSSAQAKKLMELSTAIDSIKKESVQNVSTLANSMSLLSGAKISSNLATQITNIGEASASIKPKNVEKMAKAVESLSNNRQTEVLGNISQQAEQMQATVQGLVSAFAPIKDSAESYNSVMSEAKRNTDGLVEAVATGNAGQDFGKIDASAKQMAQGVSEAKKEMEKSSAVAKWFSSGLNELKDKMVGIASAGVRAGVGHLAKEFDKLKERTIGANSFLGKMLRSLKRIATYRLIRKTISGIIRGFKEGTNNLYEWSKAFDKTREFANSMDKIATAILYVKNSLGAMISPLINALAPAIDWVADKFVGLLNVINEVFAGLTGADTYTVAKKIATEFKETADNTKKATKALKSYTIGIDELNIIEESKNEGGGGDGNSNVTKEWFEKRKVNKDIQDFFKSIKEAFEKGDWESIGRLFGEKANWIVNEKIPWKKIGTKAGKLFTAFFSIGASFLDTFDFSNLGSKVATTVNKFFKNADFSKAGEFFVSSFFAHVDFIGGFLGELDWGSVTGKISDFFIGGMRKAGKWFKKYDWKKVGSNLYKKVKEALNGLKLSDLVGEAWDLIKGVSKATIDFTCSFISETGKDLGNWVYDISEGKAQLTPLEFSIGQTGADVGEMLMSLWEKGYIDADLNVTAIHWGDTMEKIGGTFYESQLHLPVVLMGEIYLEKLPEWWGDITGIGDAADSHTKFFSGLIGKLKEVGIIADDTGLKAKKMWKRIRGEDPDIEQARQNIKDITSDIKEATPYFDTYRKKILGIGGDDSAKGIEGTVFERGKKAGDASAKGMATGMSAYFTDESKRKWAVAQVEDYLDKVFSRDANKMTVKSSGGTTAKSFVEGVNGEISTMPTNIAKNISGIIPELQSKIEAHTNPLAKTIQKDFFTEMGEDVGSVVGEVLKPVSEKDIDSIGEWITDVIIDGFKDESKAKESQAKISSVSREIKSLTKSAVTQDEWNSTGGYMTKGVVKGMVDESKSKETKKSLGEVVDNIYKQVNKDAGIASPSKLFATSGFWIVEGLNKGIADNMNSTNSVVDDWVGSFSDISANVNWDSLSTPNLKGITGDLQGEVMANNNLSVENNLSNMEDYLNNILVPIITNIATDTKRQADKNEKTEIYMDTRKVAESVNKQNRANGYSFVK